jgi:RND family efflux transporter MFP subunit
MKHLTLLIVISILSILSLSACSEAAKSIGMPPMSVDLAEVTVKPYAEKSNYLGTLRSKKSVSLSPNIDGHVVAIPVTSGQFVQPGELIMEIDSRVQSAQTDAIKAAAESMHADLATAKATLASLESTLRSKEANLEYTKTQYDRYHNLRLQGAVTQADTDNWKNNYAVASAERDATAQQIQGQKMAVEKFERNCKQAIAISQASKEQLRYYKVTAPFAGEVGDIPIKIGDYVTSATVLTTVTENHPLEVYVSIPAEKVTAIHKGMHIALVSTDGERYGDSEVIFIAPTVDSNSQTVLIKSLFPNLKSELRAEQTVKAQIVWKVRDGISIPTSAVMQAAGKYYVFIAESDAGKKLVARQAEIEVYEIDGSSYQVKSGLKPSDRIVTTGIQRLADGTPIIAKSAGDEKPESTASR